MKKFNGDKKEMIIFKPKKWWSKWKNEKKHDFHSLAGWDEHKFIHSSNGRWSRRNVYGMCPSDDFSTRRISPFIGLIPVYICKYTYIYIYIWYIYMVGGLEQFLCFHSVGNVIIPTDELHHFSEGWLNHQPDIYIYIFIFIYTYVYIYVT